MLGCGDRPLPADAPDSLWFETEHFEYYGPEGGSCEGLGERLEQHRTALLEHLGSEGSDEPIRYFYMPDGSGVVCGEERACERDLDVFTPFHAHSHELVHAYLRPEGHAPLLFTEGIASIHEARLADSDSVPARGPLEPERYPDLGTQELDDAYRSAASFVTSLVDAEGRDVFLDLYRELDLESDAETIDAALRASYGADLETLGDRWRDGPELRDDQIVRDVATCALPPVWDGGGPVTVALQPTCGDVPPHNVHPSPTRGRRLKITLPERTFLRTHSAGGRMPGFRLSSCDSAFHPAALLRASLFPGVTRDAWTELPAGDYAGYLEWSEEEEPPELEVEALPGLYSATCDAARVLPLDASTFRSVLPEEYPDGAWFAVETTEVSEIYAFSNHVVQLCPGPCDDPACFTPEDSPVLEPGIHRARIVRSGEEPPDRFDLTLGFTR